MTEVKTCLNCGDVLKGRMDKKFCDDSCRNVFNNIRNTAINNRIRDINRILRQNRRILEKLLPEGDAHIRVKKHTLNAKGFKWNFLTHTLASQQGSVYFFCYEYGYIPTGEDVIVVKRNIEYS